MKNLLSLALAVLVLAVGCKSFDKELADKMSADLSKLEQLAPGFEKLGTDIGNIANLVNNVPEAMKTEDNAAYQNLLRMSTIMNQKYQASMAEYKDLTGKFQTLVANYSAGKLKTEDAQKEYETINQAVQGYADVLDRMNQRIEAMQTEYAKMSASWNAEAEQNAQ